MSKITACANVTQSDTFSCAQSVDTGTLLTAWQQTAGSFPEPFLFVPVIDGPDGIIPDLPSKLLAAGKFSKIPFIAGTNLDEGTFSALRSRSALTPFLRRTLIVQYEL